MNAIPSYIIDHELVLAVYHDWPSFHDAEIITLKMDRSRILFDAIYNARIELVIHCFEMTQETNEKGYFQLVKHNLVHFEFEDVRDVNLYGFNLQNAMLKLIFEELPRDEAGNHRFKVVLNPAHGLGGEFIAYTGIVLSVRPCDEQGNLKT